jgi:MOSC domain-containing protein YiiM
MAHCSAESAASISASTGRGKKQHKAQTNQTKEVGYKVLGHGSLNPDDAAELDQPPHHWWRIQTVNPKFANDSRHAMFWAGEAAGDLALPLMEKLLKQGIQTEPYYELEDSRTVKILLNV